MIDPLLISTIRVGELPPVPFSLTDLIPHEVGAELKSGTIQQLLNLLRPLVGKLQFEVVRLSVNSQYITDNFDSTGLGTNLCLGFAICNGDNGTENLDGRVGIAYGASYSFIGITGGEKEHTLTVPEMPSHAHDLPADEVGTLNIQSLSTTQNSDEGFNSTHYSSSSGGGLSHNNMQPYIVQLYMMKL